MKSANLKEFKVARRQATASVELPRAEMALQGIGVDPKFEIHDPELSVALFENCVVNRYGFVMLADDETIISDIGYRHNVERSVRALQNSTQGNLTEINEPVILANGHNNYYHWHMNWLPRIALADRFADLRKYKILVHENPSAYVLDSLQVVTGRRHEECIELNRGCFRVKKLYVPVPFPNPMHSPFALRCYNGLRKPHFHGSRRNLYITRSDAPARRILNEEALMSLLQRYGFESVQPDLLSYQEQIDLFSQAGTIVAAHGAGLTNMLFCAPGFSAVELFNEYYTRVYWSLARAMGVKHYKILQSSDVEYGNEAHISNVHRTKNAHFHVNLSELEETLKKIAI